MKYLISIIIILLLILVYVAVFLFCLIWDLKFIKYGDLFYYTTIEAEVLGFNSGRYCGEFHKTVKHPHSIKTHLIHIIKSL